MCHQSRSTAVVRLGAAMGHHKIESQTRKMQKGFKTLVSTCSFVTVLLVFVSVLRHLNETDK